MNSTLLRRSLRGGAALAFLGVFALAAPAQNDTVQKKDGKAVAGKINDEKYDGVDITVKNNKQTLAWDEVASIKYAAAPADYTDAMDKIANGRANPEELLTSLGALAANDKLRNVFKQHVLFQSANVQLRLGKIPDAIAALQELLKQFPASRYLDQAARTIIDCQLASATPDAAAKTLDQLAGDAKKAGVGARFETTVKLLRANVLAIQGKNGEARELYESLENGGSLPADQAISASLGIADCLRGEKKSDDAEKRYRKIVMQDAPHQVLAAAWNGLGDMILAEGTDKRSADKLVEALYAYLRPVVLYFPLEGEATAEHERGLFGAYRACLSVSQIVDKEKDKETFTLYKQRADDLLNKLKRTYPNSKYLPK